MDIEEAVARKVCSGCLAASSGVQLVFYTATNSALLAASNNAVMALCAICRRFAELTERFLENVKLAQELLKNLGSLEDDKTWGNLENRRLQLTNVINLKRSVVHVLDIEGGRPKEEGEGETTPQRERVDVKLETEDLERSDDEAFGDNEYEPSIIDVKSDEFDPELLSAIKKEMELREIKDEDRVPPRKLRKKVKHKLTLKKQSSNVRKVKEEKKGSVKENKCEIDTIVLTVAELKAERERMRQAKSYVSANYRCERCVKGFTFRETYSRHMETHAEGAGGEPCGVCARRLPARSLAPHRASHYRRYRCRACGLVRATRTTVAEHYAAVHARDELLQCALCPKTYLKRTLLKKHIAYRHGARARHPCAQCDKTFAVVECLREHVRAKHGGEPTNASKLTHACDECGRSFKSPSHLRAHAVKHSRARDHYCVECDRHFKSEAILKSHLRNASAHVDSGSMPLGCDYCERRFMLKRDVQRHIAKMHLHIKPYKCDRCDKGYASTWSLQEHRRLAHEGYKRPLRFPCTVCDKIFDRNVILQGHMRTHTGERPYQCPKCPAAFSQSGVLHTHNRLIHLKLQRNGQPRGGRLARAAVQT